ncbi:MAG: MmgE/PrpD family protein [Rhodospirillales bacterium]|jgi:2-methylcitrate dehydratase PrpD
MPDTTTPGNKDGGTAQSAGATYAEQYADFALNLKYDDIPEDVRSRAKHLILDSIGCALASTRYDFASKIRDGLKSLSSIDNASATCSVINMADTFPLRDAVTMNAALVHGLDYDDTHMAAVVHASAVSLPPAMTIGECVNASGQEILTSYIIAMETAIRIGMAADFGFHHHGYHATGVCGHFSSVLVAGRLFGLNKAQLARAQGIMVSTASAGQEFLNDGAWNKRFHPGWAAVAGITGAHLAKGGFVGTALPYEGDLGIFNLHMGEDAKKVDYSVLTDGLGSRWETPEMAIKPYPVCHIIHAIMDAALILRKENDLKPEDIKKITILLPEQSKHLITEPEELKKAPDSDYTAKFSAFFVVGACIARGKFGLMELEPEVLKDPEILKLCALSECVSDPDTRFPEFFSGGLIIETKDGRTLRQHEPVNRGAGDRQLTDQEIIDKYMDNAMTVTDAAEAKRIRDHVLKLDQMDGKAFSKGLAKT